MSCLYLHLHFTIFKAHLDTWRFLEFGKKQIKPKLSSWHRLEPGILTSSLFS